MRQDLMLSDTATYSKTLMHSQLIRRPMAGVLRRLPSADAKMLALVAGPDVRADPWALYRWLRASHPVHRSRLGAWIVAGHAGVATVLRHPAVRVGPERVAEIDRHVVFSWRKCRRGSNADAAASSL